MTPRAAAVVLAASLAACAGPAEDEARPAAGERVDPVGLAPDAIRAGGTLPIAAVFPTIGRYAVSGEQSLQGARLAVEDLNRAGGIHGRPRLAAYRRQRP
jgi:ABC-type branched-subunit amino acid transport system substrate-binding protein